MYTTKTFTIQETPGLSAEQIQVHLGLYDGYVQNTNKLAATIKKLRDEDPAANAYAIAEVRRRLGFEFDGMRMHEYFFEQLEGGAAPAESTGAFSKAAAEKYGDWNAYLAHLKEVAGTRGIGWVVTYVDPRAADAAGKIMTAFIADHEIGQLAGLPIVLAIDVWEHAYLVDYRPATKMQYVDAVIANLNWKVAESRYDAVMANA